MIREGEQKEERDGGRGRRKEAHSLTALPCVSIIHSMRFILSGSFQGSWVLGSLFVCSTVPDSSWHGHVQYAWSRLNFIYAQIQALVISQRQSCRKSHRLSETTKIQLCFLGKVSLKWFERDEKRKSVEIILIEATRFRSSTFWYNAGFKPRWYIFFNFNFSNYHCHFQTLTLENARKIVSGRFPRFHICRMQQGWSLGRVCRYLVLM